MAATRKTAAAEDARAKVLNAFVAAQNRKNPGSVMTVDTRIMVDSISTGAPSLDYILGIGGLPKGRIIELYGPEGSGKTSLAWSVCAQAIEAGGIVGYVDAENAIDWDHAAWMGVDRRYVALSQPSSGEEGLQMAESFAKELGASVVVVDSVAALIPKAELEGEIGDVHVGQTARLMSQALRKLSGVGNETGTIFIFINQLREKIGGYGNPETTPGGRALKYYASVRLDIRSAASARITSGGRDNVVGQICTVKTVKNKLAAPFKKAEYKLYFEKGIDAADSVFDVAYAAGVVYKEGTTYYERSTGEKLAVGKDNAKAVIAANPELAGRITTTLHSVLRGEAVLPEDHTITPVDDDMFDGVDPDEQLGHEEELDTADVA